MNKQTILDGLNDSAWHSAYMQAVRDGSESPEVDADNALMRLDTELDSIGADDQF